MTRLFHYTCADHAPAIRKAGIVKPGMFGLAWFTDMEEPDAQALGLTREFLSCDRTQHRFEAVFPDAVTPWSEARMLLAPGFVTALEAHPGAQPGHWFTSLAPVRVKEASTQ